ncbi:MAG: PolC-type DNA polymerase III [Eubacterium sp.]|nr:PolC-type DNA polymerase III [Eubacterium sp.]
MNPIIHKQHDLSKLMEKYALEPQRVEIDSQNGELVFMFKSRIPECDKISVQRELTGIFDFSRSLSVIINAKEEGENPRRRAEQLRELADQKLSDLSKKKEELLKKRLAEIKDTPAPSAPQPSANKGGKSFGGQGGFRSKKKPAPEARPLKAGEVMLGDKIRRPAQSMAELDFSAGAVMESTNIVVAGRVFSVDSREITEKTTLFTFCITDEHGSISAKIFARQNNVEMLKINLKDGCWLKVEGNVNYDEYAHEKVLSPKNIEMATAPVRLDTAETKRVELHLHSQYSSMDAVSKIAKIMKQANDFGHDAIGITDHGVLQGYPEMMAMSKKYGIKVLYGVEGYLVNDDETIVTGEQNEPFDGEFIFFDLETTGLIPGRDKIIEIAAVHIKNKHIVETFSKIVNPHRQLSPFITNLTGITNQMVEAGEEEADAVKAFWEFCGDRILVAHNARFDMGFMEIAYEAHGLNNRVTYIDTLAMARTLIPSINRHNLKKLASYFKIDMGHHHRALDDSVCSAKVFGKLMELAEKQGVSESAGLNGLMDRDQIIKSADTYHIIIYAKNQKGLKELYKLVSEAHVNYFYRRPRIPKSLLAAHREDLIIGSACEAGELYRAVLKNLPKPKLDAIADFYDYFEVQPLGNNSYLLRNDTVSSMEELEDINRRIIELGREKNKLVVATGDVHFVDKNDAYFREILQAGQGYKDAAQQPPLYYRSTQEMLDEFKYLDDETAYEIVVENPRKIADMFDDVKPIPDGTFPPIIEGSDEEIREMVYKKAHEMYGDPLPEIVEQRVKRELDSIIGNGYSVLYLIAQKLVHHSLEDGYLVGSRGSVGSSLVAMLCGITEVNSLAPHYVCPKCKHYEFFDSTKVGVGPDLPNADCPECGHPMNKDGFDIPFETFLGFEGDKEPDIDLNFSGENQPEAHHYTEVLFGKGKVYRAGTIATLADKTAYGYVKNYFEENGVSVPQAEMDRVIQGCAGVKRTTGQHPGGVMVVPKDKDIYDFTPIQYPADDKESGTLTTHFDYHSISGRLLKLDILGHDDPTMLRMLKDITGVDPQTIPLDDAKVISLFTGVEALNFVDDDFPIPLGTCGIPEFGTNFVRQMVMDTKPSAFSDLIRISGLSHGTDVWTNNAQELVRSNTATIKEVICTRDDIMIGLISMGLAPKESFSIMEHVRKGKGLTEEEEAYMRENKVPEWYIDSCKKIKYMFPKAHAAAYVMMAFRIAYYKVYYPLAYYATYFSIRAKEFDLEKMTNGKAVVIQAMNAIKAQGNKASNKEQLLLTSLELALEMYCRGFEFKNVDIYKSHYSEFRIVDNALLPPLNTIDGLGDKAAMQIYEEAQKRPFISKEDLQTRAKVNKSNIEKLDAFGCLKSLPDSNQMSFISML